MTEENFKKAADIVCRLRIMEHMYKMIEDGECIRLTTSDGVREVTNDPALIFAVKSAILNRQNELAEELERM